MVCRKKRAEGGRDNNARTELLYRKRGPEGARVENVPWTRIKCGSTQGVEGEGGVR